MFRANILPGQGFKTFTVYKDRKGNNGSGKVQSLGLAPTETSFLGMLVNASQKEIEEWKQNQHPISHKIIEYSAMQKAKATDWLINEDRRAFYVQGTKNPADLNVTMIYYVEERFDLKKKVQS